MCQKIGAPTNRSYTAPTPLLHRSYSSYKNPSVTTLPMQCWGRSADVAHAGKCTVLLQRVACPAMDASCPALQDKLWRGIFAERQKLFRPLSQVQHCKKGEWGALRRELAFQKRHASFFVPRAEVLGDRASSPQERMLSVAHFAPGWTC